MSLFSKLKDGLVKTRETLVKKVTALVTSRAFDDALFDELEETLLRADVGAATAETLIRRLRERAKKNAIKTGDELIAALKDEMRRLLERNGAAPAHGVKPHVILIVGVNGVGKTTTVRENWRIISLPRATRYSSERRTRSVRRQTNSLTCGRNAHTRKSSARRNHTGTTDPGAVAFTAVQAAIAHGADVVIIDTAGRLHTKTNLMAELQKIRRVIQKVKPDAPHESLLVLDATTGQNAIAQAKHFTSAVNVTGLVLTKLDGTAKGGVVFAIAHELNLPVRYIGVGEGIEDLGTVRTGAIC